MIKKTLAGMAALLAISTVQAAPSRYEFAWEGFDAFSTTQSGETSGGWNPAAAIRGYFVGDDRNGDHVIRDNELDRFGFYDAATGQAQELTGCGGDATNAAGLSGCLINWFSYSSDGALQVMATAQRRSGGELSGLLSWAMPNGSFSDMNLAPCCGATWLRATADTRFTIAPAVPEPSTWGMLGVGLLVATGVARRRARRMPA